MSLAIQYCFFCGLPITKSKGGGPDNLIEHHVSYIPEFKVRAHGYCHGYYHSMSLVRGRREDALFPEYIRSRFLNRLHTGYGDGHIPYDQRKHHLPPFEDVLLHRHKDIMIRSSAYMAFRMGIKNVPRNYILNGKRGLRNE